MLKVSLFALLGRVEYFFKPKFCNRISKDLTNAFFEGVCKNLEDNIGLADG